MKKKYFQESDFLKSRSLDDPRLGHYVKFNRDVDCLDSFRKSRSENASPHLNTDPTNSHYSIYGYASDLGIRLNGGRPGANLAPESIRKSLYKTTPPISMSEFSENFDIADYGDFSEAEDATTLAHLHEAGARQCQEELDKGRRVVALGGGHDFGFCEAKGFLESSFKNRKPLIINFDAHLDVRPVESSFHSGTPFRRVIENYTNFEFIEVGLQRQCNSFQHLEFARNHGTKTLFREDQIDSGLSLRDHFFKSVPHDEIAGRPVFLSVDIDAFSQSSAPGCSAPWPLGFEPIEFFRLYREILKTADVRVLGVYEVSPHLDIDDRTSRLATQIVHSFIFCTI